jgi:hypothetical protein
MKRVKAKNYISIYLFCSIKVHRNNILNKPKILNIKKNEVIIVFQEAAHGN